MTDFFELLVRRGGSGFDTGTVAAARAYFMTLLSEKLGYSATAEQIANLAYALAAVLNTNDFATVRGADGLIDTSKLPFPKAGIYRPMTATTIKTGTTAQRPMLTAEQAMFDFYDTTLNKPIWWSGAVWKDATGATV